MSNLSYKRAATALALVAIPSGAVWAQGVHADAMRLAEDKQFDEALALLLAEDAEHKEEYGHRMLKARLLSWGARYDEAQSVLAALKEDFPENSEVDVSLGNLAFYQSKFDQAEAHFSDALRLSPDHSDAVAGVSRVRAAKKAEAEKTEYRWRVDAGIGQSTFDTDAIEEWGEQFISASHKGENVVLTLGATRYERFGATDTQINAAIGKSKPGGVDWGLMAAATPDANFRAKSTIGGHIGTTFDVGSKVKAYTAVHYRRDTFEDKTVQSVQPQVTAYLGGGTVVSSKVFITTEENEDAQIGWLAEVRQPLGERVTARIGYADAPELINGSTVTTQSLFGGVSFDVADNLTFHVNLARSDREDLHVRNDVSVGITRKF